MRRGAPVDWNAAPRAGLHLLAVAACMGLLVSSLALIAMRRAGSLLAAVDPMEVDLAGALDRNAHSMPSVVLASDGSVIGRFYPEQRFLAVEFEDLPAAVVDAVVAAEDGRFWDHKGIDAKAILRAFVRDVRAGEIVQGGSTITQQLVKNLYTDGEKSLDRKIEEARLAAAVEAEHPKEEILAAYLNTVYFGEGAVGIGAAAATYFRKSVGELTLSDAAMLAGLIPAPSTTNPRVSPQVAEQERRRVLDRVAEEGLATAEEVAAARADPPVVHPPLPMQSRYPYYLDYVRRWLLDEHGLPADLLYSGGLRIHTALVPAIQDAALAAVARHLPDLAGPSAAVVVVDPHTGHVRALVGGRDWAASSVNLALGRDGGGSGRQAGSAFKPFTLATAYEQGMSPADTVPAPREYVVDEGAPPVRNYDRRGHGRMTLDDALRLSVNTAYVGLAEQVGPAAVARLAHALGMKGIPSPELVGPRIALGRYEVAPLRMAAAYSSFANGGRMVLPSPVARIEAPPEIDYDRALPPTLGSAVISGDTALLVTDALRQVVERGTGRAARLGRPAAGKTGTTDDYTNAWFAGFTAELAAVVWVGHRDGAVPMRDVNGVRSVTGGSLPALVWRDVMEAAHAGVQEVPFEPPPQRPPPTTTTRLATTTTAPLTTTTTTTTVPTTTTTPPTTTPPTTTPSTTTTAPPPTTTTTTAPPPPTTTTAPPTTATTTTTTAPPTTTTTTAPPTTTTTTPPPTTSPPAGEGV